MEGDPGEDIYRAMIEDKDGMPMLGKTAVKLGVRTGVDIIPDPGGRVHSPAFRPGDPNGLSCSPTIHDLPPFALPVEWGGANRRTVVWRIDTSDLGPRLVGREDTGLNGNGRHISVAPSFTMTFDEYLQAVEATRSKWKKVNKN